MLRSALLLLLLAGPALAHAQDVRVRLFEGRSGPSALLSTHGAPLAVDVDGGFVGSGSSVRVEVSGRGVSVSVDGATASGQRARVESEEEVRLQSGQYDRRYLGSFVIRRGSRGLQIVNHVPIEPYVASVVASEYPFREIEGVKAQAILARTYALRHQDDHEDYDVEDSQRSQVYKGESVVTEVTREAAELTRGLVLRYAGTYAETVYSSSNGGHSAGNEDVWNSTPVPYLRATPDPYDAESPQHRWTTTADASRVHRALSRYGAVTAIYPERSASGHVRRVRLEPAGRSISGSQFRSAINSALGYRTLMSTNVDIRRSGDRYVFEGGGFGHGVGMSQYGARGRAKAGYDFSDILAHYFPGTSLDLVGGGMDQPLVAVGDAPRRWPTPRREAREAEPTSVPSASSGPAAAAPPRRRVVEPDPRPAWVVRDALPNGDRVRSRPTPRREAHRAEPEPETRGGWR
ncbi:MAG TPA: SpoIID/LytB domain-containing protein [Bacteroidetes bacterium]|nr:SpoIID/LytB domain-containing protein [Bacteroidota bacterium]